MNRTLILLLLGCCLIWACQSKDTPQSPKPSEEPKQLDALPAVAAKPTRPEDWTMFMSDLHFSGKSPDQILKPPLKLIWKFKTGGPIQGSPVVAYDTVYVGSNDQTLYALDAKQWGLKCNFKAGGAIRYTPAIWNNRVYFSARDNRVYALNAETGELIWQFKSETWMDSPPILSNGRVYIGAFTQKIHIINATTGELEDQPQGQVLIDGVEYVCTQGELRPIDPQNQVDFWRHYVPHTYSYPATANGGVYIGARDNKIHALDAASKGEIWSYETKGFVDSAPAISGGRLYVTSYDGYVYAFDNQSSNASQVQPDKRPIGVVVQDDAPIYRNRRSNATHLSPGPSPEGEGRSLPLPSREGGQGVRSEGQQSDLLLTLNDGVELPIIRQEADWYQVELPNGETGWMDRFALGVFANTNSVHFNKAITSNPRTLELPEGAESPRWSPDGNMIAFLKRTNLSGQYWRAHELWITDNRAQQFRKLCEGAFYNPNLSWSLDSNFIAFEAYEGSDNYVWVIDRKSARLVKLVLGDAPSWSPTANQIAFRRWEEGFDILYRINADKTGLAPIVRIPIEGRAGAFSYMEPPSWSPDGGRIAIGLDHQHAASGHARIRIHQIDGTKVGEILTQSQNVKQIEWSGDASYLAYVLSGNPRRDETLDKQLHIVPLNALNQARIFKHTSPSWSPQGNRLVYMEHEDCMGLLWKVWVLDLQTNRALPIARTTINLTSVTWLPDGKHLCLWHTSDYLREEEYKPAKTKGWIVEVTR